MNLLKKKKNGASRKFIYNNSIIVKEEVLNVGRFLNSGRKSSKCLKHSYRTAPSFIDHFFWNVLWDPIDFGIIENPGITKRNNRFFP